MSSTIGSHLQALSQRQLKQDQTSIEDRGLVDGLSRFEEATRFRATSKNQGMQVVSSKDLGNGTTQHIVEVPLSSSENLPRRAATEDLHRSSSRNKLTQQAAFDPSNTAAGMLVLSRQRDESIIIGDDIVITVVDIRGDKVRLGINAPTQIPVHRQEVYEAIQRENQRGKGPGSV